MSNELAPMQRLNELLATPGVKSRFQEMLKDKAPGFISSIISAVRGNNSLSQCDPMSVIAAAATAASLDLAINPSLGHAYIIPYKGMATFQLGYLGYVQLFLRSGQAAGINAVAVKEGQLKSANSFTGEFEFQEQKTSDKTVGYLSYFKLRNGFSKQFYMTQEEMEAHAKRYSQSYGYDLREGKKASKWSTDFEPMALKTVTKLNLKKHAPLSIEMQKALEVDDAIDIEGETHYPDAPQKELPPASEAPKTTSSKLQQAVGVTAAENVTNRGDAFEEPELPI
jgi:recombination protein RecT